MSRMKLQQATPFDSEPSGTVETVPAEWVLASKFEELTGVTRETVKQRKKCGVWREGQQVAVVHRRLYVNIKAADQWIRDHLPKPHHPA